MNLLSFVKLPASIIQEEVHVGNPPAQYEAYLYILVFIKEYLVMDIIIHQLVTNSMQRFLHQLAFLSLKFFGMGVIMRCK
jgi:hypothetical protein